VTHSIIPLAADNKSPGEISKSPGEYPGESPKSPGELLVSNNFNCGMSAPGRAFPRAATAEFKSDKNGFL